ncbi:MAG: hypothetical protein VKM01_08335 [Cyanobacteriota bacterium]|nr:hypothetical protein [Cyanobacteriota bacterium]
MSLPQRPALATPGADPAQRQALLQEAGRCFQEAEQAAQQGDLTTAGKAILEGLACERRAGGVGPQVLQLIKPRG